MSRERSEEVGTDDGVSAVSVGHIGHSGASGRRAHAFHCALGTEAVGRGTRISTVDLDPLAVESGRLTCMWTAMDRVRASSSVILWIGKYVLVRVRVRLGLGYRVG